MLAFHKHFKSLLVLTFSAATITSCSPISWVLAEPDSADESIIIVKKGGDFQAALDRARPGDTIQLEAGATFNGSFALPLKNGSEFITIRSSAPDSQLPGPDSRMDPERYGTLLPKVISNIRGKPAILAGGGAHHFRFVAVEFGPTIEGLFNIIQIGTGEETSVNDLPHNIEFDRVYVRGDPEMGQRRGIAANGRRITIKNSYISDIKRKGEESQGIAVWASDGPVDIINNYIEAAAENILFGGAGSPLKLVPTNCTVRDNHLNKPLSWKGTDWVVKNLFEIKNGRRIRIENNLMTHNWGMGQDGTAVLFTIRDEGNGTATVIEDIEFVGNIVRSAGGGISIWGGEGGGGRNLNVRNNLFEDINGPKWNSAGHFMKLSGWDGLILENNTIFQSGNIANVYGLPTKGFIFRNNIVLENEYGIKGDNMGSGQEVVDLLLSRGLVSNNMIIGGTSTRYRMKNYFPVSIRDVGFVDVNGNYNLRPDSQYSRLGVSGTHIGARLEYSTVGGTPSTKTSQ